jgi:hypothetical protein
MYHHFIIPYLHEAQHVSDDTPPIIRSPKLHSAWQRLPATPPTTFHVWKSRGCQCSFRLLMMGGVLSETCWASCKYGIIKCWYIVTSCWIFLYELYYNARIHEHQIRSASLFPTLTLHCAYFQRPCNKQNANWADVTERFKDTKMIKRCLNNCSLPDGI